MDTWVWILIVVAVVVVVLLCGGCDGDVAAPSHAPA